MNCLGSLIIFLVYCLRPLIKFLVQKNSLFFIFVFLVFSTFKKTIVCISLILRLSIYHVSHFHMTFFLLLAKQILDFLFVSLSSTSLLHATVLFSILLVLSLSTSNSFRWGIRKYSSRC